MANTEIRGRYCFGPPGLLKWLAILFSAVVLGLLMWESIRDKQQPEFDKYHDGEKYTIFCGFFTIAIELVLLIVFFLNCHNAMCAGCRCRALATWIYLLCFCLWAAAAGVQTWIAVEYKKKVFHDQEYFDRRAAAAAFCFLNVLVFGTALHQARYVDL